MGSKKRIVSECYAGRGTRHCPEHRVNVFCASPGGTQVPSGLPALHIALIQAGCGQDSPASATATSALLHLQPCAGASGAHLQPSLFLSGDVPPASLPFCPVSFKGGKKDVPSLAALQSCGGTRVANAVTVVSFEAYSMRKILPSSPATNKVL